MYEGVGVGGGGGGVGILRQLHTEGEHCAKDRARGIPRSRTFTEVTTWVMDAFKWAT